MESGVNGTSPRINKLAHRRRGRLYKEFPVHPIEHLVESETSDTLFHLHNGRGVLLENAAVHIDLTTNELGRLSVYLRLHAAAHAAAYQHRLTHICGLERLDDLTGHSLDARLRRLG